MLIVWLVFFSQSDLKSVDEMGHAIKNAGFWTDEAMALECYQAFLRCRVLSCAPDEVKWRRSVSQVIPDTISSSSTSSSTALTVKVEVGDVIGYPSDKKSSVDLLEKIFQAKAGTAMRAQDFYQKTHQLGLPSGRKQALKWLDSCVLWGLISFSPAIDGKGRIFRKLV